MKVVKVDPKEVDFAALDTPTECERGKIEVACKETSHAEIPGGTWVVDGIYDTKEIAEDTGKEYLLTRTITYKTRSGWVYEKYHLGKTLASQEICRVDGSTQKRLVWSEYGTLSSLEDRSSPEELARAVKKDGQVVMKRKYYGGSGKLWSELVAVETDYYGEGNPQLFFLSVVYDQDGKVISRSHARVA